MSESNTMNLDESNAILQVYSLENCLFSLLVPVRFSCNLVMMTDTIHLIRIK